MEFRIQVEAREGGGRVRCRQLRHSGKVPAVIYGGGQAPSAVALDLNSLNRQMEHEAFYTSILTLELGKGSEPVIVKEVQRHPTRQQVLHLDFQRIVADEEITLHVPLHFMGEESAKGVKQQGGVVEHLMSDVEVSCLPKDLPAFLEIDVGEVELNQIVHLSDIPLPAGVTLVALEHGSDQPVFTIAPPRREEEEVEEVPEEEVAPEVPTIESEESESTD